MNHAVLQNVSDNRLTLVFLGWGMDARCLARMSLPRGGVVAFWNYADLSSFDAQLAQSGISIVGLHVDVVAWSMGVWAAESIVQSHAWLRSGRLVAFCGSPRPVDDNFGIPSQTVLATAQNWSERSRTKFNLRMFGGKKALDLNADLLPDRDVDDQRNELLSIIRQSQSPTPEQPLVWSEVFIGADDAIFPMDNLIRYWQPHSEIWHVDPTPHFHHNLFLS